jgi:hypothetical protein
MEWCMGPSMISKPLPPSTLLGAIMMTDKGDQGSAAGTRTLVRSELLTFGLWVLHRICKVMPATQLLCRSGSSRMLSYVTFTTPAPDGKQP